MTCSEWLDGYFPKGYKVHCALIRDAARERGYSRFQLKAARKALGIKTVSEKIEEYDTTLYYWYREKEGNA